MNLSGTEQEELRGLWGQKLQLSSDITVSTTETTEYDRHRPPRVCLTYVHSLSSTARSSEHKEVNTHLVCSPCTQGSLVVKWLCLCITNDKGIIQHLGTVKSRIWQSKTRNSGWNLKAWSKCTGGKVCFYKGGEQRICEAILHSCIIKPASHRAYRFQT